MIKGSAEAKEHMARVRALRSKSCGGKIRMRVPRNGLLANPKRSFLRVGNDLQSAAGGKLGSKIAKTFSDKRAMRGYRIALPFAKAIADTGINVGSNALANAIGAPYLAPFLAATGKAGTNMASKQAARAIDARLKGGCYGSGCYGGSLIYNPTSGRFLSKKVKGRGFVPL